MHHSSSTLFQFLSSALFSSFSLIFALYSFPPQSLLFFFFLHFNFFFCTVPPSSSHFVSPCFVFPLFPLALLLTFCLIPTLRNLLYYPCLHFTVLYFSVPSFTFIIPLLLSFFSSFLSLFCLLTHPFLHIFLLIQLPSSSLIFPSL